MAPWLGARHSSVVVGISTPPKPPKLATVVWSAPPTCRREEGLTVPRRTVCRRRRWSEALAGAGPWAPLLL